MSGPAPAGVRRDRSEPLQFCDPGALELSVDDAVEILEPGGEAAARVALAPSQVVAVEVPLRLAPLRRTSQAPIRDKSSSPTDAERLLEELGPL